MMFVMMHSHRIMFLTVLYDFSLLIMVISSCYSMGLFVLSSWHFLVIPSDAFCLRRLYSTDRAKVGGGILVWNNNPAIAVVSIGEALMDCIANSSARGRSVEEMTASSSWTAFPGGANANLACACAKLGTRSAFIGCLGADSDGDALEQLLQETGVNVSLLQRSSTLPTRRVMVTRSSQGIPGFAGFWEGRSPEAFADAALDATVLLQQDEELQQLLQQASWLTTGTLSLAYPKSREAIYQIVEQRLQKKNQPGTTPTTRLYMDINWRPVFWPAADDDNARQEIRKFAQYASIIKMTEEEAEWLLGVSTTEALSNPQAGVLITAGEQGAAYSVLGCHGRIEAFTVNVTETTGAGDAFSAGFLHGVMSLGYDLGDLRQATVSQEDRNEIVVELVRFASAVAALTCTREGAIAAQPTFQDVESFLIHGSKVWV
jgi:fructokinase